MKITLITFIDKDIAKEVEYNITSEKAKELEAWLESNAEKIMAQSFGIEDELVVDLETTEGLEIEFREEDKKEKKNETQ